MTHHAMHEILHLVYSMATKGESWVANRQPQDPTDLAELRRLIAQGAGLEDAETDGWTAFMVALRSGLHDAAQILEEAGANTSRRGDAELIAAIFCEDAELARKAISHGANSDFKYGASSPLELATFHGRADIVEIMVAAGFPVPADALGQLGAMDITDYKIERGEDERRYARVAEILIAHGASGNINDYDGKPLIEGFPVEFYPNIHRVLSNDAT